MKPVLIDDLETYRFPSSLQVNGKYVAFRVSQMDMKNNSYSHQLWLYNMQKKTVRQLQNTTGATSFSFLKDGSILYSLFVKDADKELSEKGFFLTVFQRMNVESGEVKEFFRVPLKDATAQEINPNLFLLNTVRDNAREDIESLSGDAQEKALAAWKAEQDFEVVDELPFISDGRNFINKKRHALLLYDRNTELLSPLTEPTFETSFVAVNALGTQIAFSGIGYDRMYVRTHGIWLYDIPSKTTTTLLTPGSYQIMGLDFMDDQLVVAASPWNGLGGFPNHQIYTLPLSGGPMTLRVRHDSCDFGVKTISDCRFGGGTTFKVSEGKLYYCITQDTNAYICCWDGKTVQQLHGDEMIPTCFSTDGKSTFTIGSSDGLCEVFQVSDGKAKQITHINDEALADCIVSKPIPLSCTDKDGYSIEGFVIPPVVYDASKRYPAILNIHGGPRLVFSPAFFHEMQVLSGRGYFVFFCNPRGSAGKGESFADIRGIRGTVDYQDLMTFTDAVLRTYPAIDDKRIGVMGGSYGGYMTNWIITHTSRFAAAVSMRSISNIVGDYGVTDYGVWGTPGVYGGTPWSNPDKLAEQSPYIYAMQTTTPTLFLHSFEDRRCTMSGAFQMYAALQIKGVPTRMCLFKGCCHELSRSGKPLSRKRRLLEITTWMDRYLQPGSVKL